MDAAGCRAAVVLAATGGAMAAMWLAATHPERVTSLVLVNGTARVGQAEDYGFGVPEDLTAQAADIDVPLTDGDVPQDIAIFAPSLAHRVGFQEWWERAARRGASPATATAFNLVTFSADVRWCLPAITCPTLVIAAQRQLRQPGAARPLPGRAHRRGARFVTLPGTDLLPWAGEFDSIVDEIEEFVTGDRQRARGDAPAWPPCSSPTSSTRRCGPPRWATGSGAACSTSST